MLSDKVKLILLDNRYDADVSTGDILGKEQWTWFEHELLRGSPQLTLIGAGLQFTPTDKVLYEGFVNWPASRAKFLEILARSPVAGAVLLLSGDVHLAEFSRTHTCQLEADDSESETWRVQPLLEVTSSGMTHTWGTLHGRTTVEGGRIIMPQLLPLLFPVQRREALPAFPTTYELNWGSLVIELDGEQPHVLAELRGADGVLQSLTLPLTNLTARYRTWPRGALEAKKTTDKESSTTVSVLEQHELMDCFAEASRSRAALPISVRPPNLLAFLTPPILGIAFSIWAVKKLLCSTWIRWKRRRRCRKPFKGRVRAPSADCGEPAATSLLKECPKCKQPRPHQE